MKSIQGKNRTRILKEKGPSQGLPLRGFHLPLLMGQCCTAQDGSVICAPAMWFGKQDCEVESPDPRFYAVGASWSGQCSLCTCPVLLALCSSAVGAVGHSPPPPEVAQLKPSLPHVCLPGRHEQQPPPCLISVPICSILNSTPFLPC